LKKEAIPIATNVDMSVSSKTIGIDLNQEFGYSIQAVWTGTPIGTFTVEVSNDIVPIASIPGNPIGPNPAANVVNWSTYTNSNVTTTGTNGNWTWISQLIPYRWARLSYAATSGTGNLNVVMYAKG
jgi:hypothetical protein